MFFSRLSMNPVLRTLHEMQHEVNRVFDRWGHGPFEFASFPAVNLWEDGDELHLEAELPGLELADLEILVTGHNQLTIKGERKPPMLEKATPHRQERSFGTFALTLTLPYPVDESAIDARFEHGVLKLRLPKHEAAKPRKITVKA
jgi:HSP20 family protein